LPQSRQRNSNLDFIENLSEGLKDGRESFKKPLFRKEKRFGDAEKLCTPNLMFPNYG
jgi:hypothetical protein